VSQIASLNVPFDTCFQSISDTGVDNQNEPNTSQEAQLLLRQLALR